MEYRPFTLEDLPRTAKLYVDYYNAYEDGEGTIETTTKRIHQVMTREDAFGLLLEDKAGCWASPWGILSSTTTVRRMI